MGFSYGSLTGCTKASDPCRLSGMKYILKIQNITWVWGVNRNSKAIWNSVRNEPWNMNMPRSSVLRGTECYSAPWLQERLFWNFPPIASQSCANWGAVTLSPAIHCRIRSSGTSHSALVSYKVALLTNKTTKKMIFPPYPKRHCKMIFWLFCLSLLGKVHDRCSLGGEGLVLVMVWRHSPSQARSHGRSNTRRLIRKQWCRQQEADRCGVQLTASSLFNLDSQPRDGFPRIQSKASRLI